MFKNKFKLKLALIAIIGLSLVSSFIIFSYFLNAKNSYMYLELKNMNELSNQIKPFFQLPSLSGNVKNTSTTKLQFFGDTYLSLNEVFQNFKLDSERQECTEKNQSITTSTISYNDTNLSNLELINNGSTYYLKLNDVYKKYFKIDISKLNQIWDKFQLAGPESVPTQTDILNLEKDFKYFVKEYGNYIIQNIDEKDISLEKNVIVNIDEKEYKTNKYTISFENIDQIIDKVLEKLNNDSNSNTYLLSRVKNIFKILDKLEKVLVTEDANGIKMFPIMNIYSSRSNIVKREICTVYGETYTPVYSIYTYKGNQTKMPVGYIVDEENGNHLLEWQLVDKNKFNISWLLDENSINIEAEIDNQELTINGIFNKEKEDELKVSTKYNVSLENGKLTYSKVTDFNVKSYELGIKISQQGQKEKVQEILLPEILDENVAYLNEMTLEQLESLGGEVQAGWKVYLKDKEGIYNIIIDELVKVILQDGIIQGETTYDNN